jgi:hypothetical protein
MPRASGHGRQFGRRRELFIPRSFTDTKVTTPLAGNPPAPPLPRKALGIIVSLRSQCPSRARGSWRVPNMAWIELKADVYVATSTYTGPEPVSVNLDFVVDIRFDHHRATESTLAVVRLVTGDTVETHDPEDVAALRRYAAAHDCRAEADGWAAAPAGAGRAAHSRHLRRFLRQG